MHHALMSVDNYLASSPYVGGSAIAKIGGKIMLTNMFIKRETGLGEVEAGINEIRFVRVRHIKLINE